MARLCAGFNPPRARAGAWFPCRQKSLRADLFCARHRRALDGAILGLLQRELQHARKRPTTKLALAGRKATASNTVLCPSCGTLWEEEALLHQQQLIACAQDYVFQPPFARSRESNPFEVLEVKDEARAPR